MKKTLIIAGLISAAGLATAAPAVADDPVSTFGCSPAPMCTVNGQAGIFQSSVTDFAVNGPTTFVNSVGDLVTKGPVTFVNSVGDLVTKGPVTFVGSVNKFVTEGPKVFGRTLLKPGSEDYDPDPNPAPPE